MNQQVPRNPRVAFHSGVDGAAPAPGTHLDPPLDPHWAELSALVDRAARNRAEMARLQAERAEVCAEALELVELRVQQRRAERGWAEIGDTIPLREVVAELSCALRVGERTISNWLGDGALLVAYYPNSLEALREGRIDERHASAIVSGGMALREDLRAEYEELVLPLAETMTAPELRETARVIAARLQPDIVEQQHTAALADRKVRMYPLYDGLSRLQLDAPAALVQGAFERLTSLAAASTDCTGGNEPGNAAGNGAANKDAERGASDDRTLDQRRADVACDLLLTGSPIGHGDGDELGAIRATVQVTIPVLTLAGLSDEPPVLVGHGPIAPEIARILAAKAPSWQRVMVHPVTDEPLRVDTYRPTAALRRMLDARDRHCRWPGCRRPVHRADADHTIAYSEGGATEPGNLEILCRGHHTLKHASRWRIDQLGGGTLQFTSPTKRVYRNNAPPVSEAVPPARKPWRFPPYDPVDPAPF